MRAEDVVRSMQNPLVQRARAVLAGRDPAALVLQGDRLVDDALGAGLALEVALVADDRWERAEELARRGVAVRAVERDLLQRASSLTTSPGILAIAPVPAGVDLASVPCSDRTLIVVVAGVSDPGNLGAIARAAEAFGASALATVRGGASPWNDKALRGSMGSLLRLPVAAAVEAADLARTLAARGVRQARAGTRGGADPARFDWRGPIALWIGGETGALPAAAEGFDALTIPIAAGVESLNVAVAAAVLLSTSGRVGRGESGGDTR